MQHPRLTRWSPLAGLLLALLPLGLAARALPQEPQRAPDAVTNAAETKSPSDTALWEAIADAWRPAAPVETFRVTDVIDGDTVRIDYRGKSESLRLLSVDTEEKLSPRPRTQGSKPETLFGEYTRVWAREFFDANARVDGEMRVGLLFPGGVEARDIYGRLLCHVLLPDGRDFNLLLVREGWSPYFNKYGNSSLCHDAFAAAQLLAHSQQLGVWDPAVNTPVEEGAPRVARPYDRLLPWWEASAQALARFESRRKQAPETVLSAESADDLAAALARGKPVEVYGSIFRLFEESDGSLTVLLRSPEPDRALRLSIPKSRRAALEPLALDSRTQEFVQNHLVAFGTLTQGARGYQIRIESKEQLAPAGPEVHEITEPMPRPSPAAFPSEAAAPAGSGTHAETEPEPEPVGAGASVR